MSKEKVSGYYFISNRNTEEFYVGSTDDLSRRQNEHFSKLNRNVHGNHLLQEAFNRDSNFTFRGMRTSDRYSAYTLEQHALDEGFNDATNLNLKMKVTGWGGPTTHSTEARVAMSVAHTGKKLSEEHKQSISLANKGKNRTEQQRENSSEYWKDRLTDPVEMAKYRDPMMGNQRALGVKKSEESIERSAQANRKAVVIDGVNYESCQAVASAFGISSGNVNFRLNSNSERFQSWQRLE